METFQLAININAPKEKVWEALWKDENYRKWTAVFTEGSYAESDWQEGSKIRFLSPGGDGMFGTIKKMKANEQMIFEHQGEIKNSVEEVQDWKGATESYFLTENNGITTLRCEMYTSEEFKEYFQDTLPKALAIVKQIAEQD
ncbi:SRPBCC domain-containing protein [Pontibacter arcticus]|uniref:SRPBCC domain-containing protein n=1 Tax=Pontibacter arcticus TaxID=2080288 RepID=A0A364RDU9_9BACT|nr:SRPBCC domain-containing protein [Pontibacter arcticus]RAU82462.1 SRPBCC domain-containing protein [Pontibacter arcticus]